MRKILVRISLNLGTQIGSSLPAGLQPAQTCADLFAAGQAEPPHLEGAGHLSKAGGPF